uniref:Phosphatidylinositol-4-phosphate 5-kinase like 1 n=1 Tax=Seriola dumerili TaxID=41447 RepID=A0A3B4TSI8_SERDU
MAQTTAAGTSGAARRRYWWQLRRRWRMLGVFEINPEHEFYHLTSVMKDGMRALTQASDTLTAEHFKAEETQTHEGFEIQTFAAPVFAKLRRSLDITEEEYMNSLCLGGCYLQFVSNSKSKADFFVTNDKRFFLKTQSRREVRFLLSNLQAYMDHLEKYPHSLMVRFLGKSGYKYFIVMQSVFYPDERINIRYSKCPHPLLISSWFANQVKADAAFLQELNVLDYSLLLARQPLHQDELDGKHSLANITRTDSVLQEFHEHHHRLLPNCKNAIHVIDGPDHRYFVGIIDIFTVYNWKKKLENLWKSVHFPGRAFSTVRPNKYSRRFSQWIQDHTQ